MAWAQQVGIKMDLHMGKGFWLVNTSSRVTNSSVGKIKLHTTGKFIACLPRSYKGCCIFTHVS